MSERIRLTIAVAMTILLLVAVSAAGIALHTRPPGSARARAGPAHDSGSAPHLHPELA